MIINLIHTQSHYFHTSCLHLKFMIIQEWPKGTYGLPKTNSGCPVAAGVNWYTGWRKHDTEDSRSSNSWTSGIHFPGPYGKNNMHQHFCMKTISNQGDGAWPRGNYCIFKRSSCPSGKIKHISNLCLQYLKNMIPL